jgi:hypothetical protein
MKSSVAVIVAALLAPGLAAAQRAELTIGKADPEVDLPPDLHATIDGAGAAPPADKIELSIDGARVKAKQVTPYLEGGAPLSLVVVFEAQHLWIGNDTFILESDTPDERNSSPGYHQPLTAAIDELATAGPAGSKGALISYGDGASLRWSGELKDMAGTLIGSKTELGARMLNGKPTTVLGQDAGAGLAEALGAFATLGAARKVLVLVGDGKNFDQLVDMKQQVSDAGVEVFALHLTTDGLGHEGIGEPSGWKRFADRFTGITVASGDDLPSRFAQLRAQIADRFQVTFPGEALPWDGKAHEAVLTVDKTEIELAEPALTLAPAWIPPAKRQATADTTAEKPAEKPAEQPAAEPETKKKEGGGCCDAGGAPSGSIALALLALLLVRRQARRV